MAFLKRDPIEGRQPKIRLLFDLIELNQEETLLIKKILRTTLILFAASGLFAAAASAGAPTEQLRGTVDRVLAILQDPSLKPQAKQNERRGQLRQVIFARFDFPEMAQRSLGAEWRRRTPAEQQEFTRLFTDLLRDNYVGTIESYNGEKVGYNRESQDQNTAEVQTVLTASNSTNYSLNYRLHLVGKDWKVYDVVIEGISLVNNYRAQFSRFLAKSSYEDLVRTLKEKTLDGKK
jgi:phospholipid transport system substrate-binding protein